MLTDAPLTGFVGTADPEESRAFYGDVLGLELRADERMALVFETPNATLRVAKVEAVDPPDYTVLGWEVADIDSTVDRLVDAGVECLGYEGLPQDDRGIATFPDGTAVAWFRDPDGNTLSVTEQPA